MFEYIFLPTVTDSELYNKIKSTKFHQSETVPQEAEVYWCFQTL